MSWDHNKSVAAIHVAQPDVFLVAECGTGGSALNCGRDHSLERQRKGLFPEHHYRNGTERPQNVLWLHVPASKDWRGTEKEPVRCREGYLRAKDVRISSVR